MSGLGSHVAKLAMEAVAREDAIIEEWCEKSLVDPLQRGVLIIRTSDDFNPRQFEAENAYGIETEMRIGLSTSVPWMTIHQYPNGIDELPDDWDKL